MPEKGTKGKWFLVTWPFVPRFVSGRRPRQRLAEAIISALAQIEMDRLGEIAAFAVLPDHFQALLKPTALPLRRLLVALRRRVEDKMLIGERHRKPLAREYFTRPVQPDELSRIARLVAERPATRGLTDTPAAWPYSSANPAAARLFRYLLQPPIPSATGRASPAPPEESRHATAESAHLPRPHLRQSNSSRARDYVKPRPSERAANPVVDGDECAGDYVKSRLAGREKERSAASAMAADEVHYVKSVGTSGGLEGGQRGPRGASKVHERYSGGTGDNGGTSVPSRVSPRVIVGAQRVPARDSFGARVSRWLAAARTWLRRRFLPWDPEWQPRADEVRAELSSTGRIARQGRMAEEYVARWLWFHGYRILARNVRCREGELDVVARKGRRLIAVEVRSYVEDGEQPSDWLRYGKRRSIWRSIRRFQELRWAALGHLEIQAVLAEVELRGDGRVRSVAIHPMRPAS